MGAHIALRPGPPVGFLGWVLPQRTRPMGAHSAVYDETTWNLRLSNRPDVGRGLACQRILDSQQEEEMKSI
jgi:hypothetical protein